MRVDLSKDIRDCCIGVFMGGVSSEREISLKSGSAVFNALKQLGLKVSSVDITKDSPAYIKQLIESLNIDLVFIALHGTFGEDGVLQGILEKLGVAYTGSDSKASKLAMDKISADKSFAQAGLKVPESVIVKGLKPSLLKVIEKKIGFPLMVKPSACGSSIGLSLVNKKEELPQALELAKKFASRIIVEKFIKGREMTVGILDDQPLPPIEIITDEPFFNYQAKYKSPTTQYIVPAEVDLTLTDKLKTAGLRAHRCLSCRGFSRVDMLLDGENDVYILEVNTIPGLTERSLLPKAAGLLGIDFGQLCFKILQSALR